MLAHHGHYVVLNHSPKSAGGAVLLWWLLGLAMVSMALLSTNPTSFRRDATGDALATAKTALLGYAAGYPEFHLKGNPLRSVFVPGHLPCPNLENTNNLGQESPQCQTQGITTLGRLPWTTLGTSPLRDQHGECLWLMVSGDYKNNPKADLLNRDTPGRILIQSEQAGQFTTLAEDVVAVIIAPGPPLIGQARSFQTNTLCDGPMDASQYLDAHQQGHNAIPSAEVDGTTLLITTAPASSVNDRMVWITRQELWEWVQQRTDLRDERALFDTQHLITQTPALTQRIASCLRQWALNWQAGTAQTPQAPLLRLLWAAPLQINTAAPNTFKNDRFNDQKNLLAGRMPIHIWDSHRDTNQQSSLAGIAGCTDSDKSACRLFRIDNCPDLLPVAGHPTTTDSPDGWLDKWKDHLFYAVAPNFRPDKTPSEGCAISAGCLSVNGRHYAAIVLYAGPPLAGQQRLRTADKMQVSNYLEGINATSIAQGGREFSTTGNDRMVCLRADLSIADGCLD